MTTLLLTWNPNRFPWSDLPKNIKEIHDKGFYVGTWSCLAHKKVKSGDRVFLMRQGEEPKGIVASGFIAGRPYCRSHWAKTEKKTGKKAWYVDVKWDVLLNPMSEKILSRAELKRGILKRMNWDVLGSGKTIPDVVSRELESRWPIVAKKSEAPRFWRMAMRAGDRGEDLWPVCKKRGVAAITYWPLRYTDLKKFPRREPKKQWDKLSSAQKANLSNVAYEMKKGDVLYVKNGTSIVGKGVVTGPYQFLRNSAIHTKGYGSWCHTVPVDWDDKFESVEVKLGAEPSTVLELKGKRLQDLLIAIGVKAELRAHFYESDDSFLEGAEKKWIQTSRERNPELKKAAMEKYGRNCMVCGFNFNNRYGSTLAKDYIEVHHTKPLGESRGERKTAIKDVIVACSNCHRMLHRSQGVVLSWRVLKKKLA